MAAATLMAVGCEKNIETAPEGDDAQGVYSLTIDLPTDTKITFDGADGYKSSWDEGDKIFVQIENNSPSGGNKYQIYTLKEGDGGKKQGTFTGSGVPLNGGKVFYPAKIVTSTNPSAAAMWDLEGDPKFNFPDTYVWDVNSNTQNKLNSVVPMVGTINGTSAYFDYASGAILVEYSKMTQSTALLTINLGGVKPTGLAPLASDGKSVVGTVAEEGEEEEKGTIKIWMNKDHGMIGGTPLNAKFLIPVPAGKYTSLSTSLTRYDNKLVGGSEFKMKAGKSLIVTNKELKVLPTIKPKFPEHICYMPTPGTAFEDGGKYIVVYDRRNDTGVTAPDQYYNAYVNGDDDLREVFPETIVTLDNELGYKESDPYYGKEGVIIDQADYETGVWIMEKTSDGWIATVPGKEPWTLSSVSWQQRNGRYTGYVNVRMQNDNMTFRYIDPVTFRNGNFSPSGTHTDPEDSIYDNGCFWFDYRQQTNLKMYKIYN